MCGEREKARQTNTDTETWIVREKATEEETEKGQKRERENPPGSAVISQGII